MTLNIGTISTALNILKIPEIAGQLFIYLNNKSQQNYNKLDLSLKAYGFTLDKLLNCIDEESFIRSYRNTNSLTISIDIIKNSTQISDKEKIQLLSSIHEREIEQQDRAEKFELHKIGTVCIGVFSTLCAAGLFALQITNNSHKSIPTKSPLNFLKLPKKK